MSYSLSILRRAQKELAQIPHGDYERVVEAIRDLAENPRPAGCRKLAAREGWRIRVGDFRVIYEIDDGQRSVTVLHVGNRRDVYR
ncbi:MAG: type II toxin-antitoxin system mRNA interferase toxin, RelE/StbE family [Acidobacteria bacterium]|nr:MAG: type II toxin-antitoxin system mRNA interferase toxin, RelE/StbE family [Acidobacteriota bacterium]